jgi:hypothetical protein
MALRAIHEKEMNLKRGAAAGHLEKTAEEAVCPESVDPWRLAPQARLRTRCRFSVRSIDYPVKQKFRHPEVS